MGKSASVDDGHPRALDTLILPLYTVLVAIWLPFHPLLSVEESGRFSTNLGKILVQFARDCQDILLRCKFSPRFTALFSINGLTLCKPQSASAGRTGGGWDNWPLWESGTT